MPPVREILLVAPTHHDVGYTYSPRIVDQIHARIVSRVLDLCDEHSAVGPDQFRWTFDGIPVRTQQHGDVNGLAWGAVPGKRRAGITRLLMALDPDHGRPPCTQPTGFWWAGPPGDRVFTWLSTHYGFGEEWGILDADSERAEGRILGFLKNLNARGDYPFSTAVVHAANDIRWPAADFLDAIRHWNLAHPGIPTRTATVDEALDLLEAEASAYEIPVVSGEWSDWWSHGHGSTAREVAVYREARSFARERTWGSWETCSKPYSTFSSSHWNAQAGFAYEAYDYSRDLAIEGFFRFAARDTNPGTHAEAPNAILVVNPTERERSEAVVVEIDGTRRQYQGTTVAVGSSGLRVEPAESVLAELRAIGGGAVRVRLRNPPAAPVTATVNWPETSVEGGRSVDESAHGVADVVLRRVPS